MSLAVLGGYEEVDAGDISPDALEVAEENGEEILVPIEDEGMFEEIADIFEERLSDLYEIEEMEEPPLN